MKKFIFAAIAATCLLSTSDAFAGCDLQWGCTETITSDSGTARKCSAQTQFTCVCSSMPSDCGMGTQLYSGGCPSGTPGYSRNYGPLVGTNTYCCGYKKQAGTECQIVRANAGLDPEQNPTEVMTSEQDIHGSLSGVFEGNMQAALNSYFWGFQDGTNRSPSSGRTTSAKAKLDACLHHLDVDNFYNYGSTDEELYSVCAGSSIGCGSTMKNEHCNNNGAAVCIDRCACVFPDNNAGTGGTDITCSNL